MSMFFSWRNMFSQSPSISVQYAISKPWISGQGFWKPRMKPIIDGRCSSVCLGWKGTKSDSMSYLWCSKKHMFLSGLWQLDDKIAFFHWDFSGFGVVFFEWPFSKKFYINWTTKTLQYSDVAMEKKENSQFLDVVPRGKGWFSLLC